MSPRTSTPPVTDLESWKLLLNRRCLWEEDELFAWAKEVRAAIVASEAECEEAA